MIGFKVTVHHYSGKITGDDVVWSNEDAARLQEAVDRSKLLEWEDVHFESVSYSPLPDGQCRVGRVIHELNTVTRVDLVRALALAKLSDEERAALGILP